MLAAHTVNYLYCSMTIHSNFTFACCREALVYLHNKEKIKRGVNQLHQAATKLAHEKKLNQVPASLVQHHGSPWASMSIHTQSFPASKVDEALNAQITEHFHIKNKT